MHGVEISLARTKSGMRGAAEFFPRSYHVCGTTSIAFTTANVSLTTTQAPATQSISAALKVLLSDTASISKSSTQSHVQNATVFSSLSALIFPSLSSLSITGSLSTTRKRSPTLSPLTSSTSKRAVVSSPVSKKISASKTVTSSAMSASIGLKENRTVTVTGSPPTGPVETSNNDWKWALIGVCCLVVIVTVAGIVYWRNKKSHAKLSSQDTNSQVGVVMKSHRLQSDEEHENGSENES
ncbi:hypothetical protein pdam_00007409 [Pocillopora damicornis]|uniref:Uncharacterized protein n=1 Tax=Pocillopora damicornis TaxID=46731 RepID=A0A3M6V5U5_POCDA|nr:hypothetical protein pdam_00007409 [Pocillopora damicornis]